MKGILICVIVFSFISCNEGKPKEQDKHDLIDAEELKNVEEEDTFKIEKFEYLFPSFDSGYWQIDDYAQLKSNRQIFKSEEQALNSGYKEYLYIYELDTSVNYLSVMNENQKFYEMSLWRADDKIDIVAVKRKSQMGGSLTYFYCYTAGKFIESGYKSSKIPWSEMKSLKDSMTEELAEKYGFENGYWEYEFAYSLSRINSSIEVETYLAPEEFNSPLLRLDWNGNEFNVGKEYDI